MRRLCDESMRAGAALRRALIEARSIAPLWRSIDPDARILEIGGGYNPRFRKDQYQNAYHLDHCSTEELRCKYASDPAVSHLVGRIQPVDFVANGVPIHTVVPSDLRFDVIYSSHALEHQVDLVGHLQSVETLLGPQGRMIAVVPDHRSCFDVLRFPTVTGDVIAVHLGAHRIHRRKQIFDNFSRTVDVNPGRRVRWPDMAAMRFSYTLEYAWQATRACEQPDAAYLDAHAWTFSPQSLELLLIELYLLGLTPLAATYISPVYANQFCIVLAREHTPPDHLADGARKALERRRLALCKRLRP